MKITVNGEPHEVDAGRDDPVVDVLRDGLGLTGTKAVCRTGVCGACTITVDGTPQAACLLPAGPALSAALYALRHRSRDLAELSPAAAFWRGYRLNAGAALKVWTPYLLMLALVGTDLANFAAAGVPGWWGALLIVLAAGGTLWVLNALVITSLFAFRAVDVAKLAAYALGRFPALTLANACLLIVAGGVMFVATEAALALLASVFAGTLLWNSRAMITEVRQRFTRPDAQ